MNLYRFISLNGTRSRNKQRGLVAIFVTAAFLFFLGIAAFTVDVNHAYMNKSKLQNSVDAAALAGAYYAANDKSESDINGIIITTIEQAEGFAGNSELSSLSDYVVIRYDSDSEGDFSGTTKPASDDIYVRVSISHYPLNNYFASIFGVDKYISASAVAGPSSDITGVCNIVPLMVCAAGPDTETTVGGYVPGQVYSIKGPDDTIGDNSYKLSDIAGANANDINDAMASGYDQCVDIKPGTLLGDKSGVTSSVGNSINSRFGEDVRQGEYKDLVKYPPDTCITEPDNLACYVESDDDTNTCIASNKVKQANDPILYFDKENEFDHTEYKNCSVNNSGSEFAVSGRRVLHVPIVDCDSMVGDEAPIVTFGCFYLVQHVGENGLGQTFVGQFIKECPITNGTFDDLNGNEGPFRIVLYKDPLSEDS